MRKQRIYISGYISNGGRALTEIELELCKAKFQRAEEVLISYGYEVVNPMNLVPADSGYKEAMRICIRALTTCDSIFLLNDYQHSAGARNEYIIAWILKLTLFYESLLAVDELVISN